MLYSQENVNILGFNTMKNIEAVIKEDVYSGDVCGYKIPVF